jgi:chromosome segregation ATPase
MDHLKERTNDLNQLEEDFGQEERRLEEEIITLKIQLEEAKRKKEVMKSQIMTKEEEVENLEEEVENIEEEVVTLRVKIVKFNKNAEETKTFTSVVENEEKHSTLLEKKNEENRKSYAEVLKGRNHGQPESKKTKKDTSSRIPSTKKLQS